jgi:amino acid transporter
VFLPRVILGGTITLFLAWLNYRGVRASAIFQNWATSAVLGVFLLLVVVSGHAGSPANLKPYFSQAPLISILLTLQIVPYCDRFRIRAKGCRGIPSWISTAKLL